MLTTFVAVMLLAVVLPPTNPIAPLILLNSTVSVSSNTEISHSVAIASSPQAVGYSSWLGTWNVVTAILTAGPSPPNTPCAHSNPCSPQRNYSR